MKIPSSPDAVGNRGHGVRVMLIWRVASAVAYGRLYDLLHADETNTLPVPATIPEPDLSFLNAQPSLADLLQTAVSQIGQQLTLRLTASLTALLAPPPAATPLRSGTEGRYGEKLLELSPSQLPPDVSPFTLAAFADSQQPDACLIEINVEPPGRSWPDLADQAVTLTTASQTLHAQTDEWGTAVFQNVPRADLPTLQINITLTP